MERPRRQRPVLRPRDGADRRLGALAHGAGLLGLTVVGWAIAPFISVPVLFLAGQRRSPYLAVHAGQAALYQLAVAVAHAVYLVWLGAGFISLGGAIPNVPDFRFFDDLVEPWLTLVQVLWGLSALLWPVFFLFTVGLAARGAWRAGQGRRFWYPLASWRIRLLVEGEPDGDDPDGDDPDGDDPDGDDPDGDDPDGDEGDRAGPGGAGTAGESGRGSRV